MAKIQVEHGEVERVVTNDSDNETYDVTIKTGAVSFSHDKDRARNGRVYTRGDSGTLKNLNGEALYAYGHRESVVEFEGNHFFLDLFSNTTSVSPSEEAGYDGSSDGVAAYQNYRTYWYAFDTGGDSNLDSVTNTVISKGADRDPEVIESFSISVRTDGTDPENVNRLQHLLTVKSTSDDVPNDPGPDGTEPEDIYQFTTGGTGNECSKAEIPFPPESEITYRAANGVNDTNDSVPYVNVDLVLVIRKDR